VNIRVFGSDACHSSWSESEGPPFAPVDHFFLLRGDQHGRIATVAACMHCTSLSYLTRGRNPSPFAGDLSLKRMKNNVRENDQIYSPVRCHDEHIPIHGQVLSIPAAYIQPHGAGLEVLQEAFDDGPGLFDGEERRKRSVYLYFVLGIFCTKSRYCEEKLRELLPCAMCLVIFLFLLLFLFSSFTRECGCRESARR